MMKMTNESTTNWPDLAIGLYDRLTGRNAEITYEFSDMHVSVPSGTGSQAAGGAPARGLGQKADDT